MKVVDDFLPLIYKTEWEIINFPQIKSFPMSVVSEPD